jgi:uncharacterized protein YecA (UPF0149 family)
MYIKLRTFHETTGHFVVPMEVDKTLNKWIVYQRQRARIGKLSKERREKLEAIDFEFQCYSKHKETTFSASQVKQWEAMYEQLVKFHRYYVNGEQLWWTGIRRCAYCFRESKRLKLPKTKSMEVFGGGRKGKGKNDQCDLASKHESKTVSSLMSEVRC